MELKLNVYEKKQIVKTFTAETYDIMFGTIEDLINVIEVEKFLTGKDADLVAGVAKAIPKVFGMIKPLLKDIFGGITDDDIKHCKILDIARVLVDVIKFTVAQINEGVNEKN